MNTPIRTIVVGVASLEDEDPALAVAARLSDQLGATLHAVHAWLPAQALTGEAALVVDPYPVEAQRTMERQLAENARKHAPLTGLICRVIPGPAYGAVSQVAKESDADLLVVGASHRGKVGRVILGTTAGRVIREADSPVLVVREVPQSPIRNILMTTDLSESSGRVIDAAARVLRELSRAEPGEARSAIFQQETRSLRCLWVVWEGPPGLSMLREEQAPEPYEETLRRFLSARDAAGFEVTPRVRVGDLPGAILEEAEEWPADLLVLGTEGRTGPSRLLLGSIAEATLRDARCNALVIPTAALPQPAPRGGEGG